MTPPGGCSDVIEVKKLQHIPYRKNSLPAGRQGHYMLSRQACRGPPLNSLPYTQ